MIDFADINAKVAIAFALTLIAASLVYIAFKLSEKNPELVKNCFIILLFCLYYPPVKVNIN